MSDPRDATIAAQSAALALAREALEPFANTANRWGGQWSDQQSATVSLGKCRRARNTLAAIDAVKGAGEKG